MQQLEIRIHEPSPQGYKVEFRLFEGTGPREPKYGYVPADNITECPTNDPMAAGQWLKDWLWQHDALRDAWTKARESAPKCRVRLWIEQDAAELHTLPWEMFPDGMTVIAAAADTPFSRYLRSEKAWGSSVVKGRLRVLVVISNPDDLQKYDLWPLDVEKERTNLEEALTAKGLHQLDVEFLESPVTLERLKVKLGERRYHAVHYLGHSAFNEQEKQAELFLQNVDGNTHQVKGTELVQMFENLDDDQRPRLIFLNACESAKPPTADAFMGMGQQLILAGIPAVAAMQDNISMGSARKLSTTFYRRLLATGVVDRAMNEARSTLMMAGRSDVAVPVLFMRLKDGKLFDFARLQRKKILMMTVAILALLIAVVGGLYGMLKPAPALTGTEFNIAISKFSAGPTQRHASSGGTEMALYLRDTLRSAMSDLGYSEEQVDIRVYPAIGEDRDRAEVLLNEVTRGLSEEVVTLLVYGYEPERDTYRVYFRLRNLRESAELSDQFLNRALHQEVEGGIAAQSEILVAFASGLVRLYNGDLAKAEAHFADAISKAEVQQVASALDTLYFFHGRVWAALGQSDAAHVAYKTALEYNPEYAMAYIGLGNLIYSELREVYYADDPFDCADLDPAIAAYQRALASHSTPHTAWVEGKAHVMIGNVYLWCGQVEGDVEQLTQAVSAYDQALDVYQRDDARVEYLAMAHYVQGLAYEQLGYRASLVEESIDAAHWYNNAMAEYTWCAGNAGMRTELAQNCSKNLIRVKKQLAEVEN